MEKKVSIHIHCYHFYTEWFYVLNVFVLDGMMIILLAAFIVWSFIVEQQKSLYQFRRIYSESVFDRGFGSPFFNPILELNFWAFFQTALLEDPKFQIFIYIFEAHVWRFFGRYLGFTWIDWIAKKLKTACVCHLRWLL